MVLLSQRAIAKLKMLKLTKVDALADESELATVIIAFNNLIADLKAKGYMADA